MILEPLFRTDEMDTRLGTYFDVDESWIISRHGDERFTDASGKLIAHVRRQVIPADLIGLAKECYTRVGKMVSSNRGHASGLRVRGRSHATFDKGRNANSGIMGYIDNTNIRRPCRLTQFSKHHFEKYTRGLPFIKHIDECFQNTAPDSYERQRAEAEKTEFHIANTAFSTVTVNYNFRTSLHKDNGDYRSGCGNLVVCQNGTSAEVGGYVLFPRYKLAVALENGDFLAMDVHEYHCNSPINVHAGAERLSFVCYLRERMVECERVNATIESMQRTAVTSENWIREIFEAFGERLPEKQKTGIGSAGHEWWERRGVRIVIRYKNKRYSLFNIETNEVIHELAPAWKYAMELRNRRRSLEDDDSYQAQ